MCSAYLKHLQDYLKRNFSCFKNWNELVKSSFNIHIAHQCVQILFHGVIIFWTLNSFLGSVNSTVVKGL